MMRICSMPSLLGICAIVLVASCTKPSSPGNADVRAADEFLSAYFNLISYAKSEVKVDFSSDSCSECGVRVIDVRGVPKYVDVSGTGFEGKELAAVQRAIAEDSGRAVVLTNLPDGNGRTVNLVFLPLKPERQTDFSEGTNAVLLTNAPQAALPCGIRSFGQKGGGQHCAFCAVGICCGTCKCNPCNNFTIERSGLNLPERFDVLFDRPSALENLPIDVDLVKR